MSYFSFMNGWIQKCVWKFIYELKKTSLSSKRHTLCMCTKHLTTERETRTLTRGAIQLIPSDLVLNLHCDSGPYSHFMAKILGVNTLLFVICQNTSHIIRLGFKSHTSMLFMVAQWYWVCQHGCRLEINSHGGHTLLIITTEMALGGCQKFWQYYFTYLSAFLVGFLSRSEPVDLTSLMTLY